MVGMVVAGDTGSPPATAVVDSPVGGGYFGTMIDNSCNNSEQYDCIKFWISIDVKWIIGLLF